MDTPEPVKKFIEGLQALGYQPDISGGNRVIFDYKVKKGTHKGKEIKIGFDIPLDWNLIPPSGPHVTLILPLNPSAPKHPERVAESPFGTEWQYWSRPFPNWPKTNRSVKEYMRYINYLFETQ